MKKLGITTIASVAVNVILSLWLVNQYFYDQYFHSYVDNALGPVYPFIVLTAGLGGGSSLGYLLLRRRHLGDASGRLEKSKLFKSGGPTPAQGGLSAQGKVLPTGPPPGQVSRHTAYAVPPLPKSSAPSGAGRASISTSTLVGAKSTVPAPSPSSVDQGTQPSTSILTSTLRGQYRTDQAPRQPPTVPPTVGSPREVALPINRIPPEPSRMSIPSQWKSEPGQTGSQGPDSTVFPRMSQTQDQKQGINPPIFPSSMGQAPKPPQPSQTPFQVSKWVSPDQKGESQWTDPVPKPGLAAPQKWSPPGGQGFGPRPSQTGPPRPASGPLPGPANQRPPFPASQGGPRPLGFPAPLRPGPGPVGVNPPFRSDQPRPPGAPSPARPAPSSSGPLPQPWSPTKQGERADSAGLMQERDSAGSPPLRPSPYNSAESPRPQDSRSSEGVAPGGEMDWDTALDTILKTLKKDRGVGEKT